MYIVRCLHCVLCIFCKYFARHYFPFLFEQCLAWPVLQAAEDAQIENIYKSLPDLPPEEKIAKLSMLKLRYFTPKEIANLQGFPPEFGFPEKTTVKQRYRLLGNSLNVHVVAKLLTVLCEGFGNASESCHKMPLILDSNSKILS